MAQMAGMPHQKVQGHFGAELQEVYMSFSVCILSRKPFVVLDVSYVEIHKPNDLIPKMMVIA